GSYGDVVRVLIAGFVIEERVKCLRLLREDADFAAHREVAEQAGRGAARNLDPLDFVGNELRPVDPAAERIVHGHAVPQHQRAARAGATYAAQRNTLRGGVGNHTRRALEEREARDVTQAVVEIDPRLLLDLLPALHRDIGRRLRGDFLDHGDAGL